MGELILDAELKALLVRLAELEGRQEAEVLEDVIKSEVQKRLDSLSSAERRVNPRTMSADEYTAVLRDRVGLPDLSAVPELDKSFYDHLSEA